MCYFSEKGKKSERKRIRKSFNKLFAFNHFSWWAWLYVRSNLWNYNAVLPWIWLRSNVKVRKKGSNIYKDSISINIWPNKIETSHIHTFTHAHRRSSNLQKPYVYKHVCVCMHIFFEKVEKVVTLPNSAHIILVHWTNEPNSIRFYVWIFDVANETDMNTFFPSQNSIFSSLLQLRRYT